MPRKKPTSAKQKKAATQEKRAIKRGDLPPPEPQPRRKPGKRGRTGALGQGLSAETVSARKLQSAFVKVSPEFLETTKIIASNEPLPRPVPLQAAIFAHDMKDNLDLENGKLSCPKRPKWRFDQSKKEVEKNEEGLFKKWIAQADSIVDEWCTLSTKHPDGPRTDIDAEQSTPDQSLIAIPRAPAQFERNLEVWRQLWRVTEISQILLVLLDSRCPLLHYPPALASYLAGQTVILVLTKVDITGSARADAWAAYFKALHPGIRVVQVESYTAKPTGAYTQGQSLPESSTIESKHRAALEPHIPLPFREKLVEALREAHAELLQPPEKIRNDEQKLKKWKPRVKKEIDWNAVLDAHGGQVGHAVGGATAPRPTEEPENEEDGDLEPEHLTIGLIGQPNVGKSSLLNALFGTTKVRASKTPGKTKHFQTLFWTPEVRLVDCPGLVIPNLVPMETQVLGGILPISRISAIPACVYHASQLLPLERALRLHHPSEKDPPAEDKRTWREGAARPERTSHASPLWTAMDVLTAYADTKGWVTAKAGRSDVNRAGNAILRALAEGRIRWAFWPPDTPIVTIAASDPNNENGIWIATSSVDDDEILDSEEEDGNTNDSASGDLSSQFKVSDIEADSEEDTEEDQEEPKNSFAPSSTRFGALMLDEEAGEEDDDKDEDE